MLRLQTFYLVHMTSNLVSLSYHVIRVIYLNVLISPLCLFVLLLVYIFIMNTRVS